MKSLITAISLTVFLAIPIGVQASELDGKAVLCGADEKSIKQGKDPFGLIFDKGKVAKWVIEGSRKKQLYKWDYYLKGSRQVRWGGRTLTRDTLEYYGGNQWFSCSLSSKDEIFKRMDERIARAKNKNKF